MKPTRKMKWRLNTHIILVIFIFLILFISVSVSSVLSYLLFRMGLIPSFEETRVPLLFLTTFIGSLTIGTCLSIIGGRFFLKPFRKFLAATKEVAAGNFAVEVDIPHPVELKKLAEGFNEMTKELASIETLRNDFINTISHEFKTPVVSIRGFAKLLKKGNLSDEQHSEYLDIIVSESERLTKLSSYVLLLSKLDSTEKITEQDQFSLDEQIRRSILLLEPQLRQKQLDLEVNLEPVRIIMNEDMLSQVWLNLLSNAIKFSPINGKIEVRLSTDESYAIVSITDTGMGMDEEIKQHIFDKFYQGDPSRSTEGNGLGLSLVKRILELSHSRIIVESEPGKGSVFVVSCPLGRSCN